MSGIRTAFGRRLTELLEDRDDLDPAMLAKAMGLKDPSALSHYKAGRRAPKFERLEALAREAKVTVPWLLGLQAGEVKPQAPAPAARGAEDWHSLPKVAFTAAGSPIHDELAKDDTVWYAFHRSWVARRAGRTATEDTERLIVVQVDKKHLGESMVPTVRPGALLVVDRGPRGQGIADPSQLRAGSMYLVYVDGGLTVKRVFFTEGLLTLVSDSPDRHTYPPRVLSMKNKPLQKTVIGRVIWIGHEEE